MTTTCKISKIPKVSKLNKNDNDDKNDNHNDDIDTDKMIVLHLLTFQTPIFI
jgi:hypothetical protein